MKSRFRNHVTALMLLAPAAGFVALPGTAVAAKRVAPAPQVLTMSVNSDEGLRAGADLDFAVEGTPRSKASVALGKTSIVVNLRETSAGMYRGTYTVRSRDRIDPTATITARVTSGSRTASRSFTWPPSFQQLAMGNAPAPTPVAAPRIENFRMWPNERVEPGRELHYVIQALPGASATLDIPGIVSGVQMRETQPGRYEGTYTVRQRDNPAAFETAVATLRSGAQVATARLTNPNVARDNSPPSVVDISPRAGEVVSSAGDVVLSGNFEDRGGRGVDPASVHIVLSGRDVTGMARITPREFTYRGDLPPGRYTAQVTARDFAGNGVEKTWSFEVGGGRVGYNNNGPLPLAVTTPGNNASIDANGNLTVSGRTAPWAHVTVKVDAVSPPLGGRVSVAQPLAATTVQADRDGYFTTSVNPRGVPIPGTRYEVSLTANHNAQTAEQRITVYQRQG